jgi:hypothetical protein
MTGALDPPRFGRSTGALLAGVVTTAALSVGADGLMHATGIFPPWGESMSGGLFVWATVYRVAFTLAEFRP